jgi:hypothetical protein
LIFRVHNTNDLFAADQWQQSVVLRCYSDVVSWPIATDPAPLAEVSH